MSIFGSPKKSDTAAARPVRPQLPIDRILEMRGKGLSNNQICEALQRDGFSTTQIFDALNQADLRAGIGPTGLPPMEGQPDRPLFPDPIAQQPQYEEQYPQQQQQQSPGMTEEELVEKIEEVTETIIEEKWKDFVETVEKIIEWKNSFTERVDEMDKELQHLREEFDKLHNALLRKVEQYDKSMGNVGAQLKAMEMVFKDVLPKFTENVKELSKMTEDMSTSKKKKAANPL